MSARILVFCSRFYLICKFHNNRRRTTTTATEILNVFFLPPSGGWATLVSCDRANEYLNTREILLQRYELNKLKFKFKFIFIFFTILLLIITHMFEFQTPYANG